MRTQQGFGYIAALLMLALLALGSAMSLKLGVSFQRRAAETALLETGADFARALGRYRRATPPGFDTAPRSLQELLWDSRSPGVRRHLRQIWVDPLTGQRDWGFVRDPQTDAILAIYSLSKGQPLQQTGFEPRFVGFDHQRSYRGWRFGPITEEGVAMPTDLRGLISPGQLARDKPSDSETNEPPADDERFISPSSLR
jgi:type II secretory pathway pseudopilin PulG